MKKQVLILILSIFSLSAFSNNNVTESLHVSKVILTKFERTFPNAKEVTWTKTGAFLKVKFEINGQHMISYFNSVGDQVAVTRNLNSIQLPLPAYVSLKGLMSEGKWLTELFELAKEDKNTYYACLEDGEFSYIMKSENGGNWNLYKKTKKELN